MALDPSIALGVNVPQTPSWMDYAKLGMAQQQSNAYVANAQAQNPGIVAHSQQQQVAAQQAQREMDARVAYSKLIAENKKEDGTVDYDAAAEQAITSGADPATVFSLRQAGANAVSASIKTFGEATDRVRKEADTSAALLRGLDRDDPNDRAQAVEIIKNTGDLTKPLVGEAKAREVLSQYFGLDKFMPKGGGQQPATPQPESNGAVTSPVAPQTPDNSQPLPGTPVPVRWNGQTPVNGKYPTQPLNNADKVAMLNEQRAKTANPADIADIDKQIKEYGGTPNTSAPSATAAPKFAPGSPDDIGYHLITHAQGPLARSAGATEQQATTDSNIVGSPIDKQYKATLDRYGIPYDPKIPMNQLQKDPTIVAQLNAKLPQGANTAAAVDTVQNLARFQSQATAAISGGAKFLQSYGEFSPATKLATAIGKYTGNADLYNLKNGLKAYKQDTGIDPDIDNISIQGAIDTLNGWNKNLGGRVMSLQPRASGTGIVPKEQPVAQPTVEPVPVPVAQPTAPAANGQLPTITTKAQYDALKTGDSYLDSRGVLHRKSR